MYTKFFLICCILKISSSRSCSTQPCAVNASKQEDHVKNRCIEPGYDEICSNQGTCIDNKCYCNISTEITTTIENTSLLLNETTKSIHYYRFSGRYCEECPYCKGQRCLNFAPCIECLLQQPGNNCTSLCLFHYSLVNKIERDIENDDKICEVENAQGCYYKFKYYYDRDNTVAAVIFEDKSKCVNGAKFLFFLFWGVVLYIFVLMVVVSKCPQSDYDGTDGGSTNYNYGDVIRRTEVHQNILVESDNDFKILS